MEMSAATEVLAELGLFVDEQMSQLRLLDPQNDNSTLLREHCKYGNLHLRFSLVIIQ